MQLERITVPDETPMREMGVATLDRARGLAQIKNAEQAAAAGAELVRVRAGKKAVMDAFAPAAEAADRAHKEITKLRGSLVAYFDQANNVLTPAISAWEVEQDRIRRVEQARIQKEEQEKLEAQQLADAEAAEGRGDMETAVQILEAPVAAPVIEIPRQQVQGLSFRVKFRFEVVDVTKMDRKFLTPNLPMIQKLVDSMKHDAVGLVGGIRVVEDRTPTTRR